jgi:hypothetical protein
LAEIDDSPPTEVRPPAGSELNIRGLHAKRTITDEEELFFDEECVQKPRAFTTPIEREQRRPDVSV